MRHWSEGIAKDYLQNLGCHIIAENYRSRQPILDLGAVERAYFRGVAAHLEGGQAVRGIRVGQCHGAAALSVYGFGKLFHRGWFIQFHFDW